MGKGDKKSRKGKIFRKSYGKSREQRKRVKENLGIIAYGSLIDDPGKELIPYIKYKIKNVLTPFKVEYGRKSASRGDAPTLVPFKEGGAVKATILVLSDTLSETEARNMLYRREIGKIGTGKVYKHRENPTPNQMVIEEYENISGVEKILSTRFGVNLPEINAEILSNLAIESYKSNKVTTGRDGIAYLMDNIKNGIITPLTEVYKNAILNQMGRESLEDILNES